MSRLPDRGERRALTHVGGQSRLRGDHPIAEQLASALDVPTSAEAEQEARAHVHGFHAYPARMHPLTARRLVSMFSDPGESVLDPFCGSGTVLVEARLLGRATLGVDANPLAVRLSELKVRAVSPRYRGALVEAARGVALVADERRKARRGASRRYGPHDVELFDAHVLLELDGLRIGLDALADRALRCDLELALSAILTKVSRRASDTSEHAAPRRLAAGYPAKLFVRKVEELTRQLAEVAEQLRSAPAPRVLVGDARELAGVGAASVALVVTSPPYPGVYDYTAHHAARLRWLRLPHEPFEDREIGARRKLAPLGPSEAVQRWRSELSECLRAFERVLRPEGSAVLLIADSAVAGAPVHADELVRALGQTVGLPAIAAASQQRPHFHRPTVRAFHERPRLEHAILLRKPARTMDVGPTR
jgi:DNA modification methylase